MIYFIERWKDGFLKNRLKRLEDRLEKRLERLNKDNEYLREEIVILGKVMKSPKTEVIKGSSYYFHSTLDRERQMEERREELTQKGYIFVCCKQDSSEVWVKYE